MYNQLDLKFEDSKKILFVRFDGKSYYSINILDYKNLEEIVELCDDKQQQLITDMFDSLHYSLSSSNFP